MVTLEIDSRVLLSRLVLFVSFFLLQNSSLEQLGKFSGSQLQSFTNFTKYSESDWECVNFLIGLLLIGMTLCHASELYL